MILEQAFHYLPEILMGTHYPKQDYEGGIVSAYALAVLQELNGRNAPNPLSLLQCERPYRTKPQSWPHLKQPSKRRYLRTDLHVNLYPLRVGNSSLSSFGWRHSNWIEAKYFRALNKQTGLPKQNTGQSQHTGELMADLYRLLALVPRCVSKKHQQLPIGKRQAYSGRYMLHVYTGDIEQHISLNYKEGGQERAWLGALVTQGEWEVEDLSTDQEGATVLSTVGVELNDLRVDFSCTTQVLSPHIDDTRMRYTCVLTRLDSFRLTLNKDHWGVRKDRVIECSKLDDKKVLDTIAEFVGSRIGLKDETEEARPIPSHTDELGEELDDD